MRKHARRLRPWTSALFSSLLALSASALRLFADNFTASTTINGTTTNTADVHIGFGVPNITITVTNGGQIVNTGRTQIGYPNAASSNETVVVTGSGSILTNTTYLTVGRLSQGNQLIIANGGRVWNTSGYVGGQDGDEGLAPSNNIVLVTGSGSLWDNSNPLAVGRLTTGNQLIVTNGGRVVSLSGIIGDLSSAANNTVIVTGTGSTWSNTVAAGLDGLFLGLSGANNQLVISAGGRVDAYFGILGYDAGSIGNSLLVTGSGSLLKLNNELEVGRSGRDNQVTVSNGGIISNAGNANIGWAAASSSNNIVLVTGTGSKWNMPGTLTVGRTGSSNTLRIENGGLVESGAGSLGGRDGDEGLSPSNNTVIVTGSGSVWTNGDSLTVGRLTTGNQLVVTNGGRVVSARGILGSFTTAQNNQVIVTGAGSTWSNLANVGLDGLFIGSAGGNNQLTISGGGRVDAHFGILGYDSTSSGNSLVVTGSGSLLKLSSELEVGRSGMGNQVTISNGGTISNAANANIGWAAASSSNNIVLVTGTGSLWSLPGTLTVGRTGGSNRLEIANGGRVESGASSLGGRDGDDGSAPSNNLAVVTGAGSVWNNADTLIVGRLTGGNQVIVTNGGRVVNSQGYIGFDTAARNNQVIVTGAGSTWSNTAAVSLGSLVVGSSGANSQLIVADGGRVDAFEGNIGFGSSASNSSVLVTGNSSLLNLTTGLRVGVNSQGNQLVVTNGGTVNAGTWIRVGVGATSSGTVLVTGQGSTARGGDRMSVGANGDTDGSGSVLVTDNGVLEFNELKAGTGGSISNRGIYQFTVASPTLSPTGSGIIMVTNGTVSFRAINNAPTTPLANLSQQGNNGFRLNNATNASVTSYTFQSSAITLNPSNYQRLALINNSRWTSANLTIGTGGGLTGGAGDEVEITQNFTIQRNVNAAGDFDLSSSRVLFSGGTGHTNAITGDDFGHSATLGFPDGFTVENFSYGRLSLGSASDTICFLCGETPVAPSNALYVTWLDLLGNTNLVANLHAPSTINIYYLLSEPNNAYLNNGVYQLTDCNGGLGGLLMPVPEPSAILLLMVGGLLVGRRLRRE